MLTDPRNRSARQVAVAVRHGGVPAGPLVERLVVTADDPHHCEAAVFQSRHEWYEPLRKDL
jgi:hypothetical protein